MCKGRSRFCVVSLLLLHVFLELLCSPHIPCTQRHQILPLLTV
jgi:hypothetical protein